MTERRERAPQRGARPVGLDFGPEERRERVAPMGAALQREEREQRHRLARVDRERLPVDLDDGRAEQVEPQRHGAILRDEFVTPTFRSGRGSPQPVTIAGRPWRTTIPR